ncbi:MAG: arylesterase [Comamonadaceae bacterium]|nr:arylesterase [Comamonadaceae bacterium]
MEGLLKLKRRHFNALAVGVLSMGACSTALSQAAQARPAPKAPLILVVGDSLSAEYGLQRGQGWVALMEERLIQEKVPAQVVNASISGDTTSGGRSRLPALLRQHKPSHVIIELGANDALRGLPLNMTRDNLATMARLSREAGAQVLLLGMEMPPNYGAKYAQEFRELFATVAKAEQTALVPFFLKNVADTTDPLKLFQSDRIHPNESAQPLMLANVWPELRKLLPKR